eukprot:gnl/TRDRNA2_/TRDRNA2_36856_c0_seq1.p1 gnl/TRDRNA2_/TRDRNA2_36856_c0~~gnl/TRDRNA2_/TRDRNA2_36856_c0_seq1.p1  ORF type:complete len:140 (+),score=21.55 gnl/TRDRNA2_/TRDRNA2_36856_c0_seq1:32-421(+)
MAVWAPLGDRQPQHFPGVSVSRFNANEAASIYREILKKEQNFGAPREEEQDSKHRRKHRRSSTESRTVNGDSEHFPMGPRWKEKVLLPSISAPNLSQTQQAFKRRERDEEEAEFLRLIRQKHNPRLRLL